MNDSISLIVGLGNPGDKYTATRHNAGFWFLDQLANHFNTSFKSDAKFKGEVASFQHNAQRVWLLKPNTFMNLSGESLAPFAKYYQIDPTSVLVVHDELDLPPGTARYKRAGGHGGHNGLRDIFKHFSKDFWRLRIGVGHPGDKSQVLSSVMKPSPRSEMELIEQAMDKAMDTMPEVLSGDLEAAMRLLHKKQE